VKNLFGTDGIRGIVGAYPIQPESILSIGQICCDVLSKKVKKPVFLIGKDTRQSSSLIEQVLASGIVSKGGEVMFVGIVPSPAMAYLIGYFKADAGIMITASHNDAKHNGIKLFNSEGKKFSDKFEMDVTNRKFDNDVWDIVSEFGKMTRIESGQEKFIQHAKSAIGNVSLKGMKIVLDCAHGAAFEIAPKIFQDLGAEIFLIGAAPNGNNINFECGSNFPEKASKLVKKKKADCAFIFDGDADRLVICDEKGKIIEGDGILAILAAYMLQKKKLHKNTVVATHYTNKGLDYYLEKFGGKVIRVLNGDKCVIEEMEKHDYNLGGEYSGHIILTEYNTTSDGIIAALQLTRIMQDTGQKLSTLMKDIEWFPQVMINVKVREKKPFEKMKSVVKVIKKADKSIDSGRFLIRYSGTEDVCRVMFEGEDIKHINKLCRMVANAINKEVGI